MEFDWLTPDRVFFLVWMFSAAVQALPKPDGKSEWYAYAYRLLHLVAANTNVARKNGFKQKAQGR